MMRAGLRIAVLLLLVLPLIPVARAQDADTDSLLAPLPVRDQFLLGNGFFFFEPERAHVLERSEWSLDLHNADANTFAKSAWISRSLQDSNDRAIPAQTLSETRFTSRDSLFLIDGQTHRLTVGIHRGFGDNFELGLSIPFTSVGGGWSDGLIESVHHTLRVGNAERDAFRRNGESVVVRSGNVNYTRDRSAGAALGDIAITAKREFQREDQGDMAFAIEGALELPTGNANTLDGSGSLDGGVQLIASRQYERSRVHATLGVLFLGANRPLGTRAQMLITDTVAVSHLVTDRTAAIAQLTISESPFRNIGINEFNRRSYQLTIGAQHRVGNSLLVHVAFIENLFNFDNSADAGLVWGIGTRF